MLFAPEEGTKSMWMRLCLATKEAAMKEKHGGCPTSFLKYKVELKSSNQLTPAWISQTTNNNYRNTDMEKYEKLSRHV